MCPAPSTAGLRTSREGRGHSIYPAGTTGASFPKHSSDGRAPRLVPQLQALGLKSAAEIPEIPPVVALGSPLPSLVAT